MKRLTRLHLLSIALLLGLAIGQLFSFMVHLIDEKHYAYQRMNVANQLAAFRLRLEQRLNSTFYIARGLEVFVASAMTGDSVFQAHQASINQWAVKTLEEFDYLHNIGLSEGYIIRFSYPLAGNEAVLGRDYHDYPSQLAVVEQAIKTRLPVVAGPLTLIQGGTGIICRIPLFSRHTGDDNQDFVGIVSMVLDYDKLLQVVGLQEVERSLQIAIRGKDGKGYEGDLFYGAPSVFDEDGVTQKVTFLGGTWVVAAKPIAGWTYESPDSFWLKSLGFIISLIIMISSYLAMRGIQHRFIKAQDFTRELENRVEERTAQLNIAKIQAESANKAKSDFLAVVTHELRTPLNSIIGLTQLITSMELGAKQRDYLEKVSTSAGLLLSLINNVLSYSKIESGKEQLRINDFSLTGLAKKIQHVFEVAADEKGIQFNLNIAQSVPDLVCGDEEKILQVIVNLCSNAIKFTSIGEVTLSIEQLSTTDDGDSVLRFKISDTGIGISQQDQALLFKPFSQVDNSRSRRFQGTGLGLSISKRFVELMSGTIGVESTPEVGSQFWFDICLSLSDQSIIELEKVSSQKIDEIKSRAQQQLSGITVILAEDNPVNQLLAVTLLNKVGVDVLVAESGRQVLSLLDQHVVHGILMDVQMPEMDGIEATVQIRKDSRYKALPIIAMTANVMAEDRQQVFTAGMNGFVEKPIHVDSLYRELLEKLSRDCSFPR